MVCVRGGGARRTGEWCVVCVVSGVSVVRWSEDGGREREVAGAGVKGAFFVCAACVSRARALGL